MIWTLLGYRKIYNFICCPFGAALTVAIILPFSCRQSLSNLKRVSVWM